MDVSDDDQPTDGDDIGNEVKAVSEPSTEPVVAAVDDLAAEAQIVHMMDIMALFNGGDGDLVLSEMDLLIHLGLLNIGDVVNHEPDVRILEECLICLETVHLNPRPCCQKPVCDSCLEMYVATQISSNGIVRIGCPVHGCNQLIYHEEVRMLLRSKLDVRDRYDCWIADLNGDPFCKTCPRCCCITEVDPVLLRTRSVAKFGFKIYCVDCQLEWCYKCQAPWHKKMTCKKYQAGDVLLKHWAHERHRGQYNAQRCPKCRIFIERTEGCDHMTCSRCSVEFCYLCGRRRTRSMKLFGYRLEDHNLKYSILGCNESLLRDSPTLRRLTRGVIFGSKVLVGVVATPVVAATVVGAAVVFLPAYGWYKLGRLIRKRIGSNRAERQIQL